MASFPSAYSNKSESPCTITVTPKTSGNTYSGTIFFNIYRGEKPTYGSSAKYANTYLDSASIALDKNGCGSTTVKFNDYSYHIRAEVDHSSVSFY